MFRYGVILFLFCLPSVAATLIVVRHGQSYSNTENINSANPILSTRFPLTDLGIKQVETAAAKLKSDHGDLIKRVRFVYASPVGRAQETAQVLIKGLGISLDKMVTDYTITETGYGDNEGKTADHERNKDPAFAKEHFAETNVETMERLRAFVDRAKKVHAKDTIIVVTHGTPMTEILNIVSDGRVQNTMAANAEFRIIELK